MEKLSIVIVNWNTLEITQKCIKRILDKVTCTFEIILVDNGSSDGSKDYFKSINVEFVKFVNISVNVGFAAGNNLGIKAATGDYICLLNSDAFITNNAVENMIDCMKKTNAGMVGPLTNRAKGDQCKRSYYRFFTYFVYKYTKVDYLSFFCVLIKKEVILKVGLLDERFGLGTFEDDDYCRRVKLKGYDLVIDNKSWVWHLAHTTMKANGLIEEDLIRKNKDLFESKWNIEK